MKKFILPIIGLVSLFAITSCNERSKEVIELSTQESQDYLNKVIDKALGDSEQVYEGFYNLFSSKGKLKYTLNMDGGLITPQEKHIEVGTYTAEIDFNNLSIIESINADITINDEKETLVEDYSAKYINNKFSIKTVDGKFEYEPTTIAKEDVFKFLLIKNHDFDLDYQWCSNACHFLFGQYKEALGRMVNINIDADPLFKPFAECKFTMSDDIVTVKSSAKESISSNHDADIEFSFDDHVLTKYVLNDNIENQEWMKLNIKLEF